MKNKAIINQQTQALLTICTTIMSILFASIFVTSHHTDLHQVTIGLSTAIMIVGVYNAYQCGVICNNKQLTKHNQWWALSLAIISLLAATIAAIGLTIG